MGELNYMNMIYELYLLSWFKNTKRIKQKRKEKNGKKHQTKIKKPNSISLLLAVMTHWEPMKFIYRLLIEQPEKRHVS